MATTRSKDIWIIQGFALMHALVSLACKATGIADDLMLTLLTMLMVLILCLRRRMGMVFMAVAVVLVNIVGFCLGMGLARLFGLLPLPALVIHPLSTFISTEIIGALTIWATAILASRYKQNANISNKNLRWLLVAFVLIIILRLSIVLATSDKMLMQKGFFAEIMLDYVFSCLAVVGLAEYAIRFRNKAEKAREEADLAHYRYLILKQQVNPHFLFNSLNVLDYMIQEQSTEQASEFTRKLADIYRYMLKYEDKSLVRLREELAFVEDYVDLLKVRFGEGLNFDTDIPHECLSRSVVPCALQLLVENAIKHNEVSKSRPLNVTIKATADSIEVSNTKQPKMSPQDGVGLGMKYLEQQYCDLASKNVTVREDAQYYTVTLPLI